MKKYVALAILIGGLFFAIRGCEPAPEPAPPPSQQFFGWEPDRQGVQDFLDTLPHPEFESAAPDLVVTEQPVLLYRALPATYRNEAQQIGDCVSWAAKHAVDILLGIDFKNGRSDRFVEASSESLYGVSRVEGRGRPEGSGGYRDGSYGGAVCKWMLNYGVVYRDQYQSPNGLIDLLKYSGQRAKDWGNFGNGGRNDKGWLDNVAKQHPVKAVARINTWEDAVKALQNGYPIVICSGIGWTSERTDANGFIPRSGSWSHAMCICGVRFDIPGMLIMQSWGERGHPDQSRGIWPEDQPKGTWWAYKKDVEAVFAQGDSWAISGVQGFPPRKMHVGW